MAARRLLIVMLILLGLSTLAAALVPTRPVKDEGTGSTTASETTTETGAPDTVPKGEPLGVPPIRVGDGQIKVVPIHVGDQLELTLISSRSDELEIPALGLVEAVGPNLPARFDIFAREVGDYGIRYVQANKVVARIEVKPRKKPKKPAKQN